MTRVFPVPAPAKTKRGLAGARVARSCSGLSLGAVFLLRTAAVPLVDPSIVPVVKAEKNGFAERKDAIIYGMRASSISGPHSNASAWIRGEVCCNRYRTRSQSVASTQPQRMGYSLQKRVITEPLIAAPEHTDLTFF